ncbi:hypothetical protein Q9295_10285 [Xinfangfangia sp. CPCC 101601]|uniref:Uncharacterized protein n=1 Tax=Pseudogemmobacter lacusdianii TaxID=3069608 RepID=A0ABU0W0Y4_9RHOB|nr:hypothetical protein [Xinfangfangia sp. CPCC 101601]MDQ2066765.1 hypothetical protein [Xinfangfangia sp. CPCC 101601]
MTNVSRAAADQARSARLAQLLAEMEALRRALPGLTAPAQPA